MRELRTLLAMISSLPLHLGTVHEFEDMLRECDRKYNGTRPSVEPLLYETHYDPNLVRPHSIPSVPYWHVGYNWDIIGGFNPIIGIGTVLH